jgi:EAL domain-containing protein (putative c-di-GMP-specific phosphodiesterase class I)
VRGLDSFSPPPDNDTRVADAVRLWPEMRLWLNFPSSIHLASEERIYEVTREILEEGGHTGRLQIQISENVPPGVWRTSFPQIVRAIDDFGPPKG